MREHGTNAMYQAGKCRCVDCKEAHAEWIRCYRAGMRKKTLDKESVERVNRMIALAFGERCA